jgi:hypothetical protein
MKTNLNNKWIAISVLIIFCTVAIFTRFYKLQEPFGYIDDSVIAMLIQDSQNINDQGNPGTQRAHKRLEKYFTSETAGNLAKYAIDIYPFFAVPLSGLTYAPLQYTIYPLFINNDLSYEEVKYLSRLPSVIFSSLSILLFLFISSKIKGVSENFQVRFLFLSLICFSLEQYIYSRWALPYSAGIFCSTLLSWMLLFIKFDSLNFILFGAILSLLCCLQYQTIFLLPGLMAFFLFYYYSNDKKLINIITKLFFVPVITICMLYIIFLRSMQTPGVNYSAGQSDEYIFDPGKNISLVSIKYCINFFYENIPLAYATLIAPTSIDQKSAWQLGMIYFMLWALGTYKMVFSSGDRRLMSYGIFSFSIFFTILLMVVFKMVALGPTRHFLIYLPIFSIPVAYYISSFYLNLNFIPIVIRIFRWLPALIALCLGWVFYWNLPSRNIEMIDVFDEVKIFNLLGKYQPDMIITSCALPIVLMPSVTKIYPLIYDCGAENIRWRNRVDFYKKYKNLIFFSNIHELNEMDFNRISRLTEKKAGRKILNGDLGCWHIDPILIHQGQYTAEALNLTSYAAGRNSIYIYELTLKDNCS